MSAASVPGGQPSSSRRKLSFEGLVALAALVVSLYSLWESKSLKGNEDKKNAYREFQLGSSVTKYAVMSNYLAALDGKISKIKDKNSIPFVDQLKQKKLSDSMSIERVIISSNLDRLSFVVQVR